MQFLWIDLKVHHALDAWKVKVTVTVFKEKISAKMWNYKRCAQKRKKAQYCQFQSLTWFPSRKAFITTSPQCWKFTVGVMSQRFGVHGRHLWKSNSRCEKTNLFTVLRQHKSSLSNASSPKLHKWLHKCFFSTFLREMWEESCQSSLKKKTVRKAKTANQLLVFCLQWTLFSPTNLGDWLSPLSLISTSDVYHGRVPLPSKSQQWGEIATQLVFVHLSLKIDWHTVNNFAPVQLKEKTSLLAKKVVHCMVQKHWDDGSCNVFGHILGDENPKVYFSAGRAKNGTRVNYWRFHHNVWRSDTEWQTPWTWSWKWGSTWPCGGITIWQWPAYFCSGPHISYILSMGLSLSWRVKSSCEVVGVVRTITLTRLLLKARVGHLMALPPPIWKNNETGDMHPCFFSFGGFHNSGILASRACRFLVNNMFFEIPHVHSCTLFSSCWKYFSKQLTQENNESCNYNAVISFNSLHDQDLGLLIYWHHSDSGTAKRCGGWTLAQKRKTFLKVHIDFCNCNACLQRIFCLM